MAWAAAELLKWTQSIVLWGVAQRWGHRFVVGPDWGWVLVFYALLGAGTLIVTATARVANANPGRAVERQYHLVARGRWFVPGWFLAGTSGRAATLEAEFLAVGHGLAVLLHTPGGQTLLYDCGRLGDPTVGRRIIAPALWARGVSRIETVFLSHADQDHYDGLPDLLDRFTVGEVRISPGFAGVDNPLAIQLIDQLHARGIPVRPIAAPESWEQAGVQFTVRHPPSGWHPETSDNARSLVLDVAFAGRHLLLTGDLEQQGLDELVAQPPPEPPPDVFLSPHHGGKSANPETALPVGQAAARGRQPAPLPARTADALAPVERSGVPLLRTWRQGAIRLRWTGEGISAGGFLDDKGDHSRGEPSVPTPEEQGSSTAVGFSLWHGGTAPLFTRRFAAFHRRCRIRVGGNRLSGLGGRRVWRLGARGAAPIDQGRRISNRRNQTRRVRKPGRADRDSGSRRSAAGWPLASRGGANCHGTDRATSPRIC